MIPDVESLAMLKRIHNDIWSFRSEMSSYWPAPSSIDSLRFAFTEAGEVMDAFLRTNPDYVRNNYRNVAMQDEIADCVIMLVTALGPDHQYIEEVDPLFDGLVTGAPDGFCLTVSYALTAYWVVDEEHPDEWRYAVEDALAIACRMVPDLWDVVSERLLRLREKHGRIEAD